MEQPTGIKLCECGCGQPAPIAKRREDGYLKGEPKKFILGHSSRNGLAAAFKGDAAGYTAIHTYLRKHFPKSGVCDECGDTSRRTEYALIKGREYSRNREDYRELCKLCHNRYDETGGSRWRGVITAGMAAGQPPQCACGCGTPVLWDASHGRWFKYLKGHREPAVKPVRGPRSAVCEFCGNQYQASRAGTQFCSKACKAAHRRAVGADNVERICHQCGTTFTSNRYDTTLHCSKRCGLTCHHSGGTCPG